MLHRRYFLLVLVRGPGLRTSFRGSGQSTTARHVAVRVIGSNSRCVKADIIPQHLPSADLGPYMRTHIETTAVGGRVR